MFNIYVTRELQIKIIMRYHYIFIRIAKAETLTILNANKHVDQ